MAPVLLTGLNKIVDQPEEVSVEGVRGVRVWGGDTRQFLS